MDDDYDLDNIFDNKPKKKKKNSKIKGKVGERGFVNIFNERFRDYLKIHPELGAFQRTDGSGNKWYHAKIAKVGEEFFASDVFCKDFRFSIEAKNGYDSCYTSFLHNDGLKLLDGFLEKTEKDAKRTDKEPMLVWRMSYKPPIVFIKNSDLYIEKITKYGVYNDWIYCKLNFFLNLFTDEWFFCEKG